MSAATQLPATAASDHGRIPVLDIGPYLAGDAGAAAPLARAIARTCEDTGFLVVANHGVPPHLVGVCVSVSLAVSVSNRSAQMRTGFRVDQLHVYLHPIA